MEHRVWIAGMDPCAVSAYDCGKSATDFSHSLLALLFTKEDIASGNLTKLQRTDIQLLDQTKVHAIRG